MKGCPDNYRDGLFSFEKIKNFGDKHYRSTHRHYPFFAKSFLPFPQIQRKRKGFPLQPGLVGDRKLRF
jgi:hypothetical protein